MPLTRTTGSAPPVQLDDALTELCSHMNAAEHRLLCLVREWDQRGLSGDYGARSTANWLNFKCGIALGAARERSGWPWCWSNCRGSTRPCAGAEVSYSRSGP
ncbi:MAG: hypothetical protein U5R48_08445 [Gammaproteobacteria bacterium]|nr:hypothetical protein [Gammaproteobacteria bacterium]